ncbi:MAG: potassium transporter TrkG [Pseudomonadota bacterium]
MRIAGIPVFAVALMTLALAMLAPALFGALERDWRAGRLFLYAALFVAFCAAVLGLAARRPDQAQASAREELLTLVGVFSVAPAFAAVPIWLLRPDLGAGGALFEAVSALTTTGATLIDLPETAPRALHLWRSLMGWLGGLFTLAAAAAILAPRELLDLPGAQSVQAETSRAGRVLALGPGGRRTLKALGDIAPVYLAFTALATALLAAPGAQSTFVALSHAMGIAATSGISPLPNGLAGQGSRWAEAAALLLLAAAGTRLTWGAAHGGARPRAMQRLHAAPRDPEVRLLAIAVVLATLWILMQGLTTGAAATGLEAGARAAWGALLTSVSFVTTTGYVSADWGIAKAWAGQGSPALLLIGLATLGGGVATTAGGVKLFRIYALYRHGRAELARLPHPQAVDSTRTQGGDIARRAIVNGWVVVMLYMAAFAATLLALAAAGLGFGPSVAAAAAALSNAGPLLPEAGGVAWSQLSGPALAVCGAAMALGRIELLAAIALLDPGNWRR